MTGGRRRGGRAGEADQAGIRQGEVAVCGLWRRVGCDGLHSTSLDHSSMGVFGG